MKRYSVKCGHCSGTGLIDLPAWAHETLAAIPSGGATPPQIAETIGMAPTAVNGRLAALERWGLVRRRRLNGKTFEWLRQTKPRSRPKGIGRQSAAKEE